MQVNNPTIKKLRKQLEILTKNAIVFLPLFYYKIISTYVYTYVPEYIRLRKLKLKKRVGLAKQGIIKRERENPTSNDVM